MLASMTQLFEVWLHKSQLTGLIPDLSNCKDIYSLQLLDNKLPGILLASLVSHPRLENVCLANNKLQGPVPMFPSAITTDVRNCTNNFSADFGITCDQQVTTLLQIAGDLGYPELLSDSWFGTDACNWALFPATYKTRMFSW